MTHEWKHELQTKTRRANDQQCERWLISSHPQPVNFKEPCTFIFPQSPFLLARCWWSRYRSRLSQQQWRHHRCQNANRWSPSSYQWRRISLRLPNQVNRTSVGQVEIHFHGWLHWRSILFIFSHSADLQISTTRNWNITEVINFKLSAQSHSELNCTCMKWEHRNSSASNSGQKLISRPSHQINGGLYCLCYLCLCLHCLISQI